MPLPVEIVNDIHLMLAYTAGVFQDVVKSEAKDFLVVRCKRALARIFPAFDTAEPSDVRRRLDRLEPTVRSMGNELELLEAVRGEPIPDELNEPRAEQFAEDAFAAAMDTRSRDKQGLLGRLVAQRLYVRTETTEELTMRAALELVGKMNDDHLRLVALLQLIHYPPIPEHKISRKELDDWFDVELLPTLTALNVSDADQPDLQYLLTIGAVTFDAQLQESLYSGIPDRAENIDHRAFQATCEHYAMGSPPPGAFFRRAIELCRGRYTRGHGEDRIALGPYEPTAAGSAIADAVLSDYRRRLDGA